ncbi:MAG: hypothetical protein V4734_07640, partial [Terriglobus sp.]
MSQPLSAASWKLPLRRIARLLWYLRAYLPLVILSIVLMAIVGAMTALRTLLVKPITDNVLSANAQPVEILLFKVPH